MTVIDARPARAEALARANPARRVHAITAVVTMVGLLVTAGLVVGSWIVHDRNEERLLRQRAHEALTVAASSIGGIQGQLATASVAAETGAGDGALFRQLMQPLVADGGRFVSASVWPLDTPDPRRSVVVGAAPTLAEEGSAATASFLAAAAKRTTISVRDLLERSTRRLGYAYAIPGARSVAYAEAALPKNRKARIAADSAFADLDYALYLGRSESESHLLASSSGHGLTDGRQATGSIPFGDSQLLLVVSPRDELGGDLLAALPWVLTALGLLLTFFAAFFTERLIRRRERAEELSDRLEEVADENAALYSSQRDIAQELQRSLMPQSLPRFDGLEAAGRYEAGVVGTEVGGDWYDVLPVSEARLVFSVGDVCGRGLAAATLMASLRYSIRAYALEQADPATILDKLSALMDSTRDDTFATVICGMVDTVGGTITISRAGHPDLLAVDHDGARYVDTPLGPPIGVDRTWSYQSVTYPLLEAVTLVAFTDGLVERRREPLDVGLERLRIAAGADLPIEDLVRHVVDTLAPEGSDDDIAVLGLHWTPHLGATHVPSQRAATPATVR